MCWLFFSLGGFFTVLAWIVLLIWALLLWRWAIQFIGLLRGEW